MFSFLSWLRITGFDWNFAIPTARVFNEGKTKVVKFI